MSQNENMGYYDNLRTHREHAGLSKNKLAAAANVGVDLITKAEKHQPCQRVKLVALVKALGKDPDQEITLKSRFG
jgi:ribosome-binding protein aMBF1 (putative translation factor)